MLLSDPRACTRFAEHEVVLPVVVVCELEGERHHSELGCFAREALRLLDDLRVRHGRLDAPLPVGEGGGTLQVELDHTDPSALPDGFRPGDADSRILAVAHDLAGQGRRVTVVAEDHVRGRTLDDAFVVVDEAQSLERNVLLTVLSRIGQNSRVVLTHDAAQPDDLRVGRHDGVAAVIEALTGHPLFAHVMLTRSERSPVAALVTELLEGLDGRPGRPGRPG